MSWQNDARSRSANAVFHKHKDLVAQGSDPAAAAEGALVAPAPSYMLQQPMHVAVHMPPAMAHMAAAMPPQMMPVPMYPGGPMVMPPPGFDGGGDMAQKNALPMRVDGCFNLEPILYHNIMDSDYFRSLGKLLTYDKPPIPHSRSFCALLYHSVLAGGLRPLTIAASCNCNVMRNSFTTAACLPLQHVTPLRRFHDIVEELEKTVEHCEPHLAGQVTSAPAIPFLNSRAFHS